MLALVAVASAIYYAASVVGTMQEIYGDRVAQAPTTHGYRLNVVSGLSPEASEAGIQYGDRILAINGHPFTGNNVYLQELRKSHAGDSLALTIQPQGSSAAATPLPSRTVAVRLAPVYATRPGLLDLLGRVFFLSVIFPFGCLALGVWVVAARPRDWNAWFLLGILQYFIVIFGENRYWPGAIYAFQNFWSTLGLIAGPLSIMYFGIYFPERARLDVSLPWIKWVLTGFLVALLPVALWDALGFAFSFQSIAWLVPASPSIYRSLTFLAMASISIYFFCLAQKAGTATSPDAKRRLRIQYVGSTIANAPLFLLILYSMFTGHDIGYGVPPWLVISALLIFTLFPISLAYVVVVHRAMDLRIIMRQGTKYAFARSSLWVIRILTGYILVTAAIKVYLHNSLNPVSVALIAALGGLLLFFRFRTSKTLSLWIDRKFFREAYSQEHILNELANQAQTFTDTPALIHTVSECIGNALHIDRIAVLLRSGDTFRLQYAQGVQMDNNLLLSGSSKTIANLDVVKSPANVYMDNPDAWLLAATDSERAALRELGAEMLIPLRGRNRLLGVMALGPKRSEEPYSRTDRGLLQSVALHAGLSIENSELMHSLAVEAGKRERINREIEVAREVQERFLPQSYPAIPGVELAGAYRPAQTVGGDYYDFIEMKQAGSGAISLGIAIGDVSGKGISAALLMASLRASLRGLTRNSNGDLATMMREVNELVFEASASNRYATFFFAQLDPGTRKLAYVNAGHNAPALIRHRGNRNGETEIIRLEAGGPVIGLLPSSDYEQSTLTLQPGDILLAFTDGISEAMTADGEEWSEDRLIERLIECPDMPAAALAKRLFDAADDFAAGAPQHDDMTLLVVKLSALQAEPITSPATPSAGEAL
jgi:sigma-B regulation protein RsbU (phosphoserine phosphatase)